MKANDGEEFKPSKLIYLANAYSSRLKNKDDAKLQCAKRRLLESLVGGKLKKLYNVTLILPIAISAAMADLCSFNTGFDTWSGDDYTFISKCDEVWVLVAPGYDTSYGVKQEIIFAQNNGIPVYFVNKRTLELIRYV